MIEKMCDGIPFKIQYDYEQGIFYDKSEDGLLFVNGMLENYKENFTINIKEGPVYIENAAFMGWENLIGINLSESLKHIHFLAFNGTSLTEINLKNVEIIANDAFKESKLEKIVFGKAKSIGINAFANNNLKEIILPDNLDLLDSRAFANNNIEIVYMPNEIKKVGNGIFQNNPIKKIFATKYFVAKHPHFFNEYKKVIDTSNDLEILINSNKTFKQANDLLKSQTIITK